MAGAATGQPKGLPVQRQTNKGVKTAFNKACRRAGITHLHLHDFRHTACPNLWRAGVERDDSHEDRGA
ncbi:MAG: hypothetical protein E6K66_11880 [Nitrospirae bacterium]|nr:MAG: hypothetical protein E6K66_11880 [Nitrospirota bacterium]